MRNKKKGFNERRANKERKKTRQERERERERETEMGEERRGRGDPDHNNDPACVNYRLINHYVYKYIFL